MAHIGASGVLVAVVVALLSLPAPVEGQALTVLGTSVLKLDPVCSARTGRSIDVTVHNSGPARAVLSLSAGEIISKTPGKTAVVPVTLRPADAMGPAVFGGIVPAGASFPLRVELKGVLDEGEWTLDLQNAGKKFASVLIVNPPAPFGVKVEAANPESPEFSFEWGTPSRFLLKNEDPIEYRVELEYSLMGNVSTSRPVVVPAKGAVEASILPLDSWFTADSFFSRWLGSALPGLFKDQMADGRLVIRASPEACAAQTGLLSRIVKTKTKLARWPAWVKEWVGNGLIFVVLAAGGVCSLLLNFALPAQSRRHRVKSEAALIARQIEDLPFQVDSRVRSAVTVDHRRLTDRLVHLKWYEAEVATEMTEIEEGFKRLRTRLNVIGEMDVVSNTFWRVRVGAAESLISEIEEYRRQLLDLLRRPDFAERDSKAADDLLGRVRERLTNPDAVRPEIAARISARMEKVRADFNGNTGRYGMTQRWRDLRIALGDDFREVLGENIQTAAGSISPHDYYALQRSLFILEQVGEFIRLSDSGTLAGESAKAAEERVRRFLGYLRGRTTDDLQRAERIIRQMKSGIFPERIVEDVEQRRLDIEWARNPVRQNESTELRLSFRDPAVNSSAAREEFVYVWEFGHDNLKERGWSVSHAFPRITVEVPVPPGWLWWPRRTWNRMRRFVSGESGCQHYPVKVSLVRDGEPRCAAEEEIQVWPPLSLKIHGSVVVELLRLGLALGIVTAGLVAGAREQILKLDVFPALLAIFLLGFGSDRVKNLLTPGNPSRSVPSSTAAAGVLSSEPPKAPTSDPAKSGRV